MNNFLLVDFGATRIKAALCSLNNGNIFSQKDYNNPQNIGDRAGRFEIDPLQISLLFKQIINEFIKISKGPITGIVLSLQMHGFILLDEKNIPISPYISWRDERSIELINNISSHDLILKDLGGSFREVTGMKPRAGLPIFNVLHFLRENSIKQKLKLISLGEWIALCSNNSTNCVHPTMIAGTGLYNIFTETQWTDAIDIINKITGSDLILNKTVIEGCISGYFHDATNKIPIFVGMGDHQCAVLGAKNKAGKTLSINIGTGSQVAIIENEKKGNMVEYRPYFNGYKLSTITHIPAGRALTVFLDFLKSIYQETNNSDYDFWSDLEKIDTSDINTANLNFDLALYKSAVNFKNGGAISNIEENNFTYKNYLNSLYKAFIYQYLEAIKELDPNNKIEKYILSGGVAKKQPNLSSIFSQLTNKKVIPAIKGEETFIGLRTIALICAKKANSIEDAGSFF